MPILDIFKKKKEKQKEKPKEKPIEKPKETVEKPIEKPKEVKEKITAVPKREKKIDGEAYRILKSPHITEKATDLTKKNQYVFKVYPLINKIEIKKAIEDTYGVDVLDVKIIKVPKKRRRLGRITGWRKGYKKAIIKVKEGQKIEVLPR